MTHWFINVYTWAPEKKHITYLDNKDIDMELNPIYSTVYRRLNKVGVIDKKQYIFLIWDF